MQHLTHQARERLRRHTGVVIPVYLPTEVDVEQGAALVKDTLDAYVAQVADPATVCLSVDGADHGAEVARRLAAERGATLAVAPVNRGKLQAARRGAQRLLAEHSELAYIAIVDQDGDHFANELLNFVRTAMHIAAENGGAADAVAEAEVLILGQRSSRHRPMGFVRGELEGVADYVLLDILHYHAALSGRPLHLEYALMVSDVPDFHSGYKLFSRGIAARVFGEEPRQAGVSDDCYYRHACEAVMTVEALAGGAYLGLVNRSTYNQQPISTFALFDRVQFMADTIIWPARRLDVPPRFVQQWLANHTPRLLLNTLWGAAGPTETNGQALAARLEAQVLRGLGEEPEVTTTRRQPLFL